MACLGSGLGSNLALNGRESLERSETRKEGSMKKRESGFSLIELLIAMAIIGILAAIAIPNLLTAVQRGKQKRTMSDMRALATAIEAYAVDHSQYPVATSCPTGVTGMIGSVGAIDAASFSLLSPTYVSQPQKMDGWGNF